MSIPYTEWNYLLPPRTNVKIPWNPKGAVQMAWARMSDAIGQLKWNGSRSLIAIDPDDNIKLWNRHRVLHRTYTPPESLLKQVRALDYPHGHWNIFDAELMHLKGEKIKNTLCVFDTLVWKSEYLLGATYKERFGLVQPLIPDFFPLDFERIDGKVYIAQNFLPPEWEGVWNRVQSIKEIEGLVLKRTGPVSRLTESGDAEYNNGGFMCRIRKPFKNSQF